MMPAVSSFLLVVRDVFIWLRLWLRAGFDPAFVAGFRAERHFELLAVRCGWVLERIDQSRSSFAAYRGLSPRPLKRGDFICRNCSGVEVEVKCKSLYADRSCYFLGYFELMCHREMQLVTGSPVVFAFFERVGSGFSPDSLCMIPLDALLSSSDYLRGSLYHRPSKCVRIPLRLTLPGFDALVRLGGSGSSLSRL